MHECLHWRCTSELGVKHMILKGIAFVTEAKLAYDFRRLEIQSKGLTRHTHGLLAKHLTQIAHLTGNTSGVVIWLVEFYRNI